MSTDQGTSAAPAERPVLKVTREGLPEGECYPRAGSYEWNCWPILAIETGGYADLEITEVWSGKRAHIYAYKCESHQADPFGPEARACEACVSTTVYDALRRLVNAMEAAQFFGTDETEIVTDTANAKI